MRSVHKFLNVSPSEWLLLMKTTLVMIVVKTGLRLSSFRTTRTVSRKISNCGLVGGDAYAAEEIIWAVNVISHYIPGTRQCLVRALVAKSLLDDSYSSELRIGVRLDEEGMLEAHSWVEINNRILLGEIENISQYRRLSTTEKEL